MTSRKRKSKRMGMNDLFRDEDGYGIEVERVGHRNTGDDEVCVT